MKKFKEGDRVRITQIVSGSAIGKVGDTATWSTKHYLDNALRKGKDMGYNPHKDWYKFELVEEAKMSKYDELKGRIDKVEGWSKEADDILQEITKGRQYQVLVHTIPNNRTRNFIIVRYWDKEGSGSWSDWDTRPQGKFEYDGQCRKNDAFKKAFTWLLDNSDIKKEDKKAGLEAKIEDLERQIDEIRKEL